MEKMREMSVMHDVSRGKAGADREEITQGANIIKARAPFGMVIAPIKEQKR